MLMRLMLLTDRNSLVVIVNHYQRVVSLSNATKIESKSHGVDEMVFRCSAIEQSRQWRVPRDVFVFIFTCMSSSVGHFCVPHNPASTVSMRNLLTVLQRYCWVLPIDRQTQILNNMQNVYSHSQSYFVSIYDLCETVYSHSTLSSRCLSLFRFIFIFICVFCIYRCVVRLFECPRFRPPHNSTPHHRSLYFRF